MAGGVGTAVSIGVTSLLPESEIRDTATDIISGAVGGIAAGKVMSRVKARAAQQRNRVTEERQALLGRGERLGGNPGISNLTNEPPRVQPDPHQQLNKC